MPITVEPRIYQIAAPAIDWNELDRYFKESGYGDEWLDRWKRTPPGDDIEALDEFAARRCYRSFQPGLNANITQVRTDSAAYFDNIKAQKHGSVFEHGMFTFAFEDVSRVFTHELVRHRVGVGISQESMRYVRLTDLRFWFPDWALHDDVLMRHSWGVLEVLENHQRFMTYHFGLEADPDELIESSALYGAGGKNFFFKKFVTSFMRRFAPEGVATGIVWSANPRILRHVLSQRTAMGAEEEIRLVFGQVAEMVIESYPLLFGDFYEAPEGHPEATDPDGRHVFGVYVTDSWKV